MRLGILPVLLLATATQAQIPANQGKDEDARLIKEVVEAHNRIRAEAKLRPLEVEPRLTRAARLHAEDMARTKTMSHDGSDGSTVSQRVDRQGYFYQTTGENVARGWPTSAAVIQAWLDSPPHKANIVGDYTQLGVGLVRGDDGKPYWCVDFGKPWAELDPAKSAESVLNGLNDARRKAQKPLLRLNPVLTKLASEEAKSMAKADSLNLGEGHGEEVMNRAKDAGYIPRKFAQLAASGQPKPSELVAFLVNQEDDRAMIQGDFLEAGVGVAVNAKKLPYWSIILARPLRESAPPKTPRKPR